MKSFEKWLGKSFDPTSSTQADLLTGWRAALEWTNTVIDNSGDPENIWGAYYDICDAIDEELENEEF